MNTEKKIAVIGQGYVGLPLAIEFSKLFSVIGFDINNTRIGQLQKCIDVTQEVEEGIIESLKMDDNPFEVDSGMSFQKFDFNNNVSISKDNFSIERAQRRGLYFSSNKEDLRGANIYIITVPTPIDKYNVPNLEPLLYASQEIGSVLSKGDLIIYESTVYPGCTEEDCVPVLEQSSGLKLNKDFYVGYSPERISPGDKINTLTTVKKVTSGSTPDIAEEVDKLYKLIIKAGTYKAPSIKVAEASKAIENAQRDVNISFVNELALIFDKMGIDTQDVLAAARTKYNFLSFTPGLVGGHCISVDPFYLAHKASQLGYIPKVILSGRRVNDQIAGFIVSKVIKLMVEKDVSLKGGTILILGITFKENCPDVRNTKVIDIYRELKEYGLNVDVYDPWANIDEVYQVYGINLLKSIEKDSEIKYDAIILATAHKEFLDLDINRIKKIPSVIFDAKSFLPREWVDARL